MRSTSMRLASFVAPVTLLLWSGLAAAQQFPTLELATPEPPPPVPDFELDVADGQPAEHFAARFASAVPKADRAPANG